jgi:hypothetical protein
LWHPLDPLDPLVDDEPELDEDEAELDEEEDALEAELLDETPLDVEVELPPLDVEVEPPLVEVEPPLVELDVESPLEVEAVKKTLPVEPPPKKPPLKKPPPKPKPPPPEPPMTIGGAPPPLTISTGGGGIIGAGAMPYVRVITVRPGWRTTQAVRTMRRLTTFARAYCRGAGAALAWRTSAGRCGGFSATCTAPAPMAAPPAVQAHNFARAILTDIAKHPVRGWDGQVPVEQVPAASGYP